MLKDIRYHSSWTRNGVPRRKPHSDDTHANGGHPREGFWIQLVWLHPGAAGTGTGTGTVTGTGASIEGRLAREFSEFPERFG
ncbi:hypothetical protein M0802_012876 [Mischocyttarus mexicanus]|nr:hypothetical protein M0802_012876 [Mischocyttarus mexicanus]